MLKLRRRIRVFDDYDFLSKYAKQDQFFAPHQVFALKVAEELDLGSAIDIGGGTTSYIGGLDGRCETAVVDTSAASLDAVKAKCKIKGSLPLLPITRQFEFVSALEVLEHIIADDFLPSLKEIGRLSSRYVLITSPFEQDLSAGYVRCNSCATVFQCEGHTRSIGYSDILSFQQYFGGLSQLYFIGTPEGKMTQFRITVLVKGIIRRCLQKIFGLRYCNPPFTKCPQCKIESFDHYEDYLKRELPSAGSRYWRWEPGGQVSSRFGVLYDKTLTTHTC